MSLNTLEQIVSKAISDASFRRRLLSSPAEVLAQEGIELPEGVKVRVVESTGKEIWVVLPGEGQRYKFLSPYAGMYEASANEGSRTCANPAAGCAM
jgi:hypothetical protein